MTGRNRNWRQHIIPCAIRIHADLTATAQGVPPTLRQIHYQLLSAPEMLALPEWQRYNGSDSDQTTLSRITAEMRRAGTIPRVSEPGRWMRVHDWDEDASKLLREIEFHSNRHRDLLDVNMFITRLCAERKLYARHKRTAVTYGDTEQVTVAQVVANIVAILGGRVTSERDT